MKPITDAQMFAHQLADAFDRANCSDTAAAIAVRAAISRTWAHDCRLDPSNEVPRDERLATALDAADLPRAWLDTALRELSAVARALYPDDADAATMSADELTQQATRLHELCAHEHEENVTLRARNIALESDLASRNGLLSDFRRQHDAFRAEISWLRERVRPSAPDALSPITQSAPLKVGDRVRLRDATVDSVAIGGEIALATVHSSRPGVGVENSQVRVFMSAIAGRVTP